MLPPSTRYSHSDITLLYERYANELLSYGIGLGADREDIRDAIHDIFVKLYQSPRAIQPSSERFYLLRALKNRLINIHRDSHGVAADVDEKTDFRTIVSVQDEYIEREESEQVRSRIEAALADLTPRQREAIYLRYTQELDYEHIAELLNMTVPSVRNLVCRALCNMKDLMRGHALLAFIICNLNAIQVLR